MIVTKQYVFKELVKYSLKEKSLKTIPHFYEVGRANFKDLVLLQSILFYKTFDQKGSFALITAPYLMFFSFVIYT